MKSSNQSLLLALILPAVLGACAASADKQPYRGDYIFGHEVNSFCPEINSQCYWLGPNSSQTALEQLKKIYQDKKPGLYKPVCVVVEGVVDRESPRSGFASDYDGLIDIMSVHGACDDGATITPGDLNHRRWVLAERDGAPVAATESPVVLDFGESLFVEGRARGLNDAGTGFAFPSHTIHHARDGGLNAERQQASEAQVRAWCSAQELLFPTFTADYRKKGRNTLDYPPEGSPEVSD